MKFTKKEEIKIAQTIIRLFTERYNQLAKQGTTFLQRKHIANYIEEQKEYLAELQKLKDTATPQEVENLYWKIEDKHFTKNRKLST